MAREKELFRLNLERLDEAFPSKAALKYTEIAAYLGRTVNFVQKHYKQYYRKDLAGVSKTVLANLLS